MGHCRSSIQVLLTFSLVFLSFVFLPRQWFYPLLHGQIRRVGEKLQYPRTCVLLSRGRGCDQTHLPFVKGTIVKEVAVISHTHTHQLLWEHPPLSSGYPSPPPGESTFDVVQHHVKGTAKIGRGITFLSAGDRCRLFQGT